LDDQGGRGEAQIAEAEMRALERGAENEALPELTPELTSPPPGDAAPQVGEPPVDEPKSPPRPPVPSLNDLRRQEIVNRFKTHRDAEATKSPMSPQLVVGR
jgi:hypothetical protein